MVGPSSVKMTDAGRYSLEEQRLLQGAVDDLPAVRSSVIRIFLSSTFSDTKAERNALMKRVFPPLKEYCRATYGCQFQVVDMRWGVPDEATTDHTTGQLCMQEILNCQALSAGPNFVALIGDRCGWRGLPAHISQEEFSIIRDHTKTNPEQLKTEKPASEDTQAAEDTNAAEDAVAGAQGDLDLLQSWYIADENSCPLVFCLQPLTVKSVSDKEWAGVSERLLRILRSAVSAAENAGKFSSDTAKKYFISVTEEEVNMGIINYDKTARSRTCLAFLRTLVDPDLSHSKAKQFVDLTSDGKVDEESQSLQAQVKANIESCLPEDNIIRVQTKWSNEGGGISEETNAEYIDDFCRAFETKVRKMIDAEANAAQSQPQNSFAPVVAETLSHSRSCARRLAATVPRTEILQKIKKLVKGAGGTQPIVVCGESGSGKTSVMSAVMKEIPSWIDKDTKVLARFLGTTPKSSTIMSVVKSLTQQLNAIRSTDEELPQEFAKLTKYFWSALAAAAKGGCHYVVILDSIDQLQDDDDNPFSLTWLHSNLPKNVHVLISSLEMLHGIVENARSSLGLPPSRFVPVGGLSADLAWEIMTKWLGDSSRSLTPDQTERVKAAISNQPTALYVKMVFDRVRLWKSYSETENLPENVSDAIDQLFSDLERKHGKLSVEKSLGYVSLATSGISETELEDVMSLDDTYLTCIYQYHVPPIRRVPSILWSRIHHDVNEYIVEKEADGVSVMAWYHRQFIEKANERYNTAETVPELLATIESYFMGEWSNGKEKPFVYTARQLKKLGFKEPNAVANRYVPAQPTCFDISARSFNLRKLHVLSDLWVAHKMPRKVADHFLFEPEFLIGKLHSDSWSLIRSQLNTALHALREMTSQSSPEVCEFGVTLGSLSKNFHSASLYSASVGSILYGIFSPYYGVSPRLTALLHGVVRGPGVQHCGLVPCNSEHGSMANASLSPACFLVYPTQDVGKGLEMVTIPANEEYGDRGVLMSLADQFVALDPTKGEAVFKAEGIEADMMATLVTGNGADAFTVLAYYDKFSVTSLARCEVIQEIELEDGVQGVGTGGNEKIKAFWCVDSQKKDPADILVLVFNEEELELVSLRHKKGIFRFKSKVLYHANVYELAGCQYLVITSKKGFFKHKIDAKAGKTEPVQSSSVFKPSSAAYVWAYARGSAKDMCAFDAFACDDNSLSVSTDETCETWRTITLPAEAAEIHGARVAGREHDVVVVKIIISSSLILFCSHSLEMMLAVRDGSDCVCFTPGRADGGSNLGGTLMFRLSDGSEMDNQKDGRERLVVDLLVSSNTEKARAHDAESVGNGLISCKRLTTIDVGIDNAQEMVANNTSLYISDVNYSVSGWSIKKILTQKPQPKKPKTDTSEKGDAQEFEKMGIFNLVPHPTQPCVLVQYLEDCTVGIYNAESATLLRRLVLENQERDESAEEYAWADNSKILVWYSGGDGVDLFDWEDGSLIKSFSGNPKKLKGSQYYDAVVEYGWVSGVASSRGDLLLYDRQEAMLRHHKVPALPSTKRTTTFEPLPEHRAAVVFSTGKNEDTTTVSIVDLDKEDIMCTRKYTGNTSISSLAYHATSGSLLVSTCDRDKMVDTVSVVSMEDLNTLTDVSVESGQGLLFIPKQDRGSKYMYLTDNDRFVFPLLINGTGDNSITMLDRFSAEEHKMYGARQGYICCGSAGSYVQVIRAADGMAIGELVVSSDVTELTMTCDSRFVVLALSSDQISTFYMVDANDEEQRLIFEKDVSANLNSNQNPTYDVDSCDPEKKIVWEQITARYEELFGGDSEGESRPVDAQKVAALAQTSKELNLLIHNPDGHKIPEISQGPPKVSEVKHEAEKIDNSDSSYSDDDDTDDAIDNDSKSDSCGDDTLDGEDDDSSKEEDDDDGEDDLHESDGAGEERDTGGRPVSDGREGDETGDHEVDRSRMSDGSIDRKIEGPPDNDNAGYVSPGDSDKKHDVVADPQVNSKEPPIDLQSESQDPQPTTAQSRPTSEPEAPTPKPSDQPPTPPDVKPIQPTTKPKSKTCTVL